MSSLQIAKDSAGGSLVLFLGNVFSVIPLAAASILVARLLGPDQFGVYTLVFVIPSIFLQFTDFGFNLSVSRYAASYVSKGDPNRAREVTRRGIAISLALGATLSVANYALGPYLAVEFLGRPVLFSYVQLASVYVLAGAAAQTTTAAFIGWGSMGKVSIFAVLQAVIKLAVGPGMILLGFGLYGAIVGYIVAYVVQGTAATLAIFSSQLSRTLKTTVTFTTDARMMARYGLPTFAGGILSGVASQYLTAVLAIVATNATIGYYQAAINITTAVTLVSSSASTVFLRSFASLEGIKADLAQAFDYAVRYVSLLLTPVVFFLIASAPTLLDVVYGQFYSGGVTLLLLAAASYLPVSLGLTVLSALLNGMGKTRLTMLLHLIWAVTLLVSGPVLAIWLKWGAEGVVLAILVTNIATAASGLALSLKYAQARLTARPLAGVFASAIASLGVTRLIPSVLFPQTAPLLAADMAVFTIVYLSAIPLFGGIGREDIERLRLATGHIVFLGPVVGLILSFEGRVLSLRGARSKKE